MLSRVAERIYWLGRYLERTENTARLVNVYSNLLLDLPKGTKVGWETLISIIGEDQLFNETFDQANERNVTKFLLSQKDNTGCILNSLKSARENARTTREIMPAEAGEIINDLYLFMKDNISGSISRSNRQHVLKQTISKSQQLTGLLSGCMSNNDAYKFIVLGRNLERADMTSRIIDVGASVLMPQSKNDVDLNPYGNSLWMSVLYSLDGYQMYRRDIQHRVEGEAVVEYLLMDESFPRTLFYCLNQLSNAAQTLPNNESCLRTIAGTLRRLQDGEIKHYLSNNKLHEFIDDLQLEFSSIHNEIANTWFLQSSEQTLAS